MQNQMAKVQSRYNYDNENDQHVRAIDRLVHELGMPAEDVNRFYREVLEDLKKDTKMKPFLPVLVSLSVKERLRQRRP
jgi:uncharacterized protein DUF3562